MKITMFSVIEAEGEPEELSAIDPEELPAGEDSHRCSEKQDEMSPGDKIKTAEREAAE